MILVADSFWSGAGGPIIAAVLGFLGGIGAVLLRTWLKARDEGKRRAEELRGSGRSVAETFNGTASALRVAEKSAGSLAHWVPDDTALSKNMDLLRKEMPSDLWTQVADLVANHKTLWYLKSEGTNFRPEVCEEFADSFESVAKQLEERYNSH